MATDFHAAVRNPRQVYASPDAVLRDDSLTDEQKRDVLVSWENEAIHMQDSVAEGFQGGESSHLDQVKQALDTLERGQ